MKHDDLDKRVSAYVDGALRGSKRDQLERELQLDEKLARQVTRSRALGRAVREAWSEGPPAPAPEYLLAAIRPALAEIDRERRARPAWQRTFESLLARLGESLRPSPALAAAAAFAFVAALAVIPRIQGTQDPVARTAPAATAASTYMSTPASLAVGPFGTMISDFNTDGTPPAVYVSPPGRPALLLRGRDGAMTLWLIDEGDLSYRLGAGGWG